MGCVVTIFAGQRHAAAIVAPPATVEYVVNFCLRSRPSEVGREFGGMPQCIVPVILCGGAGARLWPLSSGKQPKPFHVLTGERSCLQLTALRFSGSGGGNFLAPIVICSTAHAALVRRQLAAVGVSPLALIVEPQPGGTAVAAAIAARAAGAFAPGAVMLLAPSDHQVDDPGALRDAILRGAGTARARIVLVSARPDRAETGYGYIRRGPELAPGVAEAADFIEKPDAARASALLEDGRWVWNTGLFLAAPEVMADQIARHAPEVHGAAEAAWSRAQHRRTTVRLGRCDPGGSFSLDRAVIERSARLAVAACDCGWRDVGCWSSLWNASGRDASDNHLKGPATAVDSSGCLVWSTGARVAVIGLRDIVVVTTADGVLVVPRDRAQDVRRLAAGPAARPH